MNIVLGVTGSIAAHKSIDLASQLTHAGHRVHVVLTADAQRFVTPLPFKTLTRQPVITDLYDEEEGWKPTHVRLADDALTCIALALRPEARVLIAPAMNGKMWLHPATQANVDLLKSRGVEWVGPGEGMLSCGYEGLGRLAPVEEILREVGVIPN